MKRWFPPTVLPDGSAIVPLVKHRSSPTETPATPRVGLHAYGPDGTLQWHRPIPTAWAVDDDDQLGPTPEYRVSTPAVMNGVGYAVATLLRDEKSTDRYPARADATLLAFDTATGAERWRVTFPGEGTEAVAPVVANGRVYAVVPSEYGNDDATGRLVAYDQQGEQLWSVNLPGSAYHLAAVGNLLYVTLGDGGVIAYGPA
jgi:outer membrane protein assembly factor BamB